MQWKVALATSLFLLAAPVLGAVKGFLAGVYAYLAMAAFRKKRRARYQ